jgi:hypothetical protein
MLPSVGHFSKAHIACMPQTRTGKSGKGVPKLMDKDAETKPASDPGQIGVQLGEAYMKLGKSLHEGTLENHKHLSEAAASFAKAKQELESDTAKRAAEAYHDYVKRVRGISELRSDAGGATGGRKSAFTGSVRGVCNQVLEN